MPHKANADFFKSKRHWSKRKDLILSYYLAPYTPKVATQGKPILFVDGFAGPGRFNDGDIGSPLIIATHLDKALKKGLRVNARMLAIEADTELHTRLESNLKGFDFAETRHSSFLESIAEIQQLSLTHSVFLYVDPWAIEGLDWAALDGVFQLLGSGSSIEMLLNFNVQAFARRARSALKLSKPESTDEGAVDDEDWERAVQLDVQADRLDAVAGGNWWREIIIKSQDFSKELEDITQGYCDQLRSRFREVFVHSIKAKESHVVPKYVLIFASRSDYALPLINDAAVKSLEMHAEAYGPPDATLFEMRSEDLVPPESEVYEAIRRLAPTKSNALPRRKLIVEVIRALPGRHLETRIRQVITEMLKSDFLQSETGRARINDQEKVWRTR